MIRFCLLRHRGRFAEEDNPSGSATFLTSQPCYGSAKDQGLLQQAIRTRHAWLVSTLALCFVLAARSYQALPMLNTRSGYRQAADMLRAYAKDHEGVKVARSDLSSLTENIWRYYLVGLVDYDIE